MSLFVQLGCSIESGAAYREWYSRQSLPDPVLLRGVLRELEAEVLEDVPRLAADEAAVRDEVRGLVVLLAARRERVDHYTGDDGSKI